MDPETTTTGSFELTEGAWASPGTLIGPEGFVGWPRRGADSSHISHLVPLATPGHKGRRGTGWTWASVDTQAVSARTGLTAVLTSTPWAWNTAQTATCYARGDAQGSPVVHDTQSMMRREEDGADLGSRRGAH